MHVFRVLCHFKLVSISGMDQVFNYCGPRLWSSLLQGVSNTTIFSLTAKSTKLIFSLALFRLSNSFNFKQLP